MAWTRQAWPSASVPMMSRQIAPPLGAPAAPGGAGDPPGSGGGPNLGGSPVGVLTVGELEFWMLLSCAGFFSCTSVAFLFEKKIF